MSILSRRPTLVCLVLGAALLACGTTAPSRFYTLSAVEEVASISTEAVRIGVGPWSLPEYLNRPQIVTQTEGAELEVARYHRWAEPLEDAFGRVLAVNLGRLLGSATVLEFAAETEYEVDYAVYGRVYRFDLDASGTAVLDIQWAVESAEGTAGQFVHGPQRSRYEEPSSAPASHDAGVQALDRTLARFSRDIAEVIGAL